MIVVQLTGLQHCDWDKVKETIGPKNLVAVEHEPEWDFPAGTAYKVMYGGYRIGYIPLVDTLRGYYKAAGSDAGRKRVAEWGQSASKVREWLDSRLKYHHEEKWLVPVVSILSKGDDGWNFDDRGEPRQISIGFEGVE